MVGFDAGGGDAAAPTPPSPTCDVPAPLVDTSTPKTVVGTGTPESCTEVALDAAVAKGASLRSTAERHPRPSRSRPRSPSRSTRPSTGESSSPCTVSHHSANFGGGIWIGHNAIAKIQNDTIAYNTANMGGGIWFAGGITGTLLNVTVADNPGNGMAGGDSGVTLQNTLVDDNAEGAAHMEGEVSCDHTHTGAGVNIELPGDPSSPCTSSVVVAESRLGALTNNGGVTDTMAPMAGSPAIGKGTGCPSTDQRGKPRKMPCTLGAHEMQ